MASGTVTQREPLKGLPEMWETGTQVLAQSRVFRSKHGRQLISAHLIIHDPPWTCLMSEQTSPPKARPFGMSWHMRLHI